MRTLSRFELERHAWRKRLLFVFLTVTMCACAWTTQVWLPANFHS